MKSLDGQSVLPFVILGVLTLPACPGGPGPGPQPTPTPQPTPPHTEQCQELLDQGYKWCHEEPPQQCSSVESPCVHNPSQDPRHCEEAPKCDGGEPLPEPQCPTFTDRGGTFRPQSQACDCYFGQTWNPCEPDEGCSFPQGQEQNLTMGPVMRNYAPTVNTAMRELTGCDIGTDCRTGMEPDEWMHAVIEAVKTTGLCAGRHIDTTPGGTDEIAVAARCDGWWEGYKVYNYGGGKVIWSPNADRPAWKLNDPSACGGGPGPTPPPTPPPSGDCPEPHPDTARMQFKCREHNGILDCTWVTINQPDFCASIGYCCMPGTGNPPNTCGSPGCVPRGGCPVRGDGDPLRPICEAELCDQKWKCNGEPYPPYRGNPAQSDCRGRWETFCANAPTYAEGER